MKIRHYGFLSSRQREARLHQARRLLLPKLALPANASSGIEPAEPVRCPACGSVRLARGELLPRTGASPFVCVPSKDSTQAVVADTSQRLCPWRPLKVLPAPRVRAARCVKFWRRILPSRPPAQIRKISSTTENR